MACGAVVAVLGVLKAIDTYRPKSHAMIVRSAVYNHRAVLICALGLMDFVTDIMSLMLDLRPLVMDTCDATSMKAAEAGGHCYPELRLWFYIGTASLVTSVAANVYTMSRVLSKELRQNTRFRKWYRAHGIVTTGALITGISGVEALRVLNSYVLSILDAPISVDTDLGLQASGLLSFLFEDVPQALVLVVTNQRMGWSKESKISLVLTSMTLLYAFGSRISATILYCATSGEGEGGSQDDDEEAADGLNAAEGRGGETAAPDNVEFANRKRKKKGRASTSMDDGFRRSVFLMAAVDDKVTRQTRADTIASAAAADEMEWETNPAAALASPSRSTAKQGRKSFVEMNPLSTVASSSRGGDVELAVRSGAGGQPQDDALVGGDGAVVKNPLMRGT